MYRSFEHSPGIAYDFSRLMDKLESLKGEADHRCLGGFQTEDQKFAHEMAELIRDMIAFMDNTDDMIIGLEQDFQSQINDLNNEIDYKEEEIARLETDLRAAEDKITNARKLKRLLREILIDD